MADSSAYFKTVMQARSVIFLCARALPLAQFAGHVWKHLFLVAALPKMSRGSLVENARLDDPSEPNAVHYGVGLINGIDMLHPSLAICSFCDFTRPREILPDSPIVSLSPVFFCVSRYDAETLWRLPLKQLRAPAPISIVEYAIAMGADECVSVLVERLGGVSILLSPHHEEPVLNSQLLLCLAGANLGNVKGLLQYFFLELRIEPHPTFNKKGLIAVIASATYQPSVLEFALGILGWSRSIPPEFATEILFAATCHGFLSSALVDRGLDVNSMLPTSARTALMHAVSSRHQVHENVAILLDYGADPNAQDNLGRSVLWFCASFGSAQSMLLLLESGVDLNTTDQNGKTALFGAVEAGRTEAVGLLLRNMAQVNVQDFFGMSPLMWASLLGETESVGLLLDYEADPALRARDGESALFCAISRGHTDCARLLLEHGAEVNAKSGRGKTALMRAASLGYTDCARLLLEHGADANAKVKGKTALDFARDQGNQACIELLATKRHKC